MHRCRVTSLILNVRRNFVALLLWQNLLQGNEYVFSIHHFCRRKIVITNAAYNYYYNDNFVRRPICNHG
jgi:hypothetical protein